jgi:hypothetical protein
VIKFPPRISSYANAYRLHSRRCCEIGWRLPIRTAQGDALAAPFLMFWAASLIASHATGYEFWGDPRG